MKFMNDWNVDLNLSMRHNREARSLWLDCLLIISVFKNTKTYGQSEIIDYNVRDTLGPTGRGSLGSLGLRYGGIPVD